MPRDLTPTGVVNVSTLPVSGSAGQLVYLTTDGSFYKWNGLNSVWDRVAATTNTFTVPTARVWKNTTTAIGSASSAYISFTTTDFDTNGMFNGGAPDRLTVQTPGYYLVSGAIELTANVGNTQLGLELNGATFIALSATGGNEGTVTGVAKLTVNDFVRLRVLARGGSVTVSNTEWRSSGLELTWLGAGSNTITESGIPEAQVYNNATQAVTTGTSAALTFNTEIADTDSIHDTTANTSRLTARTPGTYLITAAIQVTTAVSTSHAELLLRKNGTTSFVNSPFKDFAANVVGTVDLVAGDYVEVVLSNSTGSTLTVGAGTATSPTFCYASATRLGSNKTVIPTAQVYHNTTQTALVSGTDAALAFNTEIVDNDNIHDTVTNNSRLTCKTPGTYVINANVEFPNTNTTGTRSIYIKKNGTTVLSYQRQVAAATNQDINVAAIADMAVNDYVEAFVQQNSGVNVTISAATAVALNAATFSMAKLGN